MPVGVRQQMAAEVARAGTEVAKNPPAVCVAIILIEPGTPSPPEVWET